MCYRSADFTPPEAASDRHQLASIGWVAGERSQAPIVMLDPIEGDDEYAGGIAVWQHPRIMIAEDPQLWRVADEFATGARRTIRPDDYDTLSNWHIVAVLTQAAAHDREEARRIKALTPSQEVV